MAFIDELKYIATGREAEPDVFGLDDDGLCKQCGGVGYDHLVCPACGFWDWRDEQDRIDDAILAEAFEDQSA